MKNQESGKMPNWKEFANGSCVLCGDGKPFDKTRKPPFWISFNPCPCLGIEEEFESDTGGAETALCNGEDFFVLNGDFRASYENLVPLGFGKCKKFYDKQAAAANAKSSWSD